MAPKPKTCLLPPHSHEIKIAGMWTYIAYDSDNYKAITKKVCFLGKVKLSDAKVFPRSLILTSEPSLKLERSPMNSNASIPWDLPALRNF